MIYCRSSQVVDWLRSTVGRMVVSTATEVELWTVTCIEGRVDVSMTNDDSYLTATEVEPWAGDCWYAGRLVDR